MTLIAKNQKKNSSPKMGEEFLELGQKVQDTPL